jgi:processing peptidase subunit beta
MGVGRHISSPFCANIAEMNLARSVTVFNHAYSDVGIFGVQLVQDEHQCEDTTTLHFFTTQSMTRLCYRVNKYELERAKNIFKNQILSQYEGRLDQVLEEVGKQMLFYGRRPSAAEMFARIDAITEKDINRVATKYIYDQDPVIVNIGEFSFVKLSNISKGKTDNCPDWNFIKVFTYTWK